MSMPVEAPHARGTRPKRPGLTAKPEVESMIRVDHAGEFGALQIYQGQLAVLGRKTGEPELVQAIRRMAEQEQEHFAHFDRMMKDRGVRPTALQPLWRIAGFALGAATALMGEKAAMACTVAVEEVIDGHYRKQIDSMPDHEPELKQAISEFRGDELQHRDVALEHGATEAPAYRLLSSAIRLCCRTAITLSEKI
jgi:ubiquinone biosynthesis monooxygenase Coq7